MMNTFSAWGTVALQAFILVIIWSLFFTHRPSAQKFLHFVRDHAFLLVFLASLMGIIGSLIYSDIIGFPPCALCWYQRIFLYPQVIIAGIALLKKRDDATRYLLGLSLVGAGIALYHTLLQYGGSSLLPCPSAATGISCTQRFVWEFGYISIPLMSLTLFVFILTVLFIKKRV